MDTCGGITSYILIIKTCLDTCEFCTKTCLHRYELGKGKTIQLGTKGVHLGLLAQARFFWKQDICVVCVENMKKKSLGKTILALIFIFFTPDIIIYFSLTISEQTECWDVSTKENYRPFIFQNTTSIPQYNKFLTFSTFTILWKGQFKCSFLKKALNVHKVFMYNP